MIKIVLLLILIIIVGYIIYSLKPKKCKYWKKCGIYDRDSPTCNQTGGIYYDSGGYAGCYRVMKRKEELE